jgi:hypothetical protein
MLFFSQKYLILEKALYCIVDCDLLYPQNKNFPVKLLAF